MNTPSSPRLGAPAMPPASSPAAYYSSSLLQLGKPLPAPPFWNSPPSPTFLVLALEAESLPPGSINYKVLESNFFGLWGP